MSSLEAVAKQLVAKGKGILAADESLPSIEKRFKSISIPSTEENRRAYREVLFTAPDVERYISGVILFDETMRHKTSDGTPFPQYLEQRGILPGIKVDKGVKPLAGFPEEKIAEGLDGLRERFAEYRQLGAKFAKWRAVITIGNGIPSSYCIEANSHALARYAALAQEAGLVPIVEPEVLMDGAHSMERCAEVTEATLASVFDALFAHRVALEGSLLKPNMIVPGKDHPTKASVAEVAEATVRVLRRAVPAAVPGIVFLSGGQSEATATAHLNAMNVLCSPCPWQLSFSYGRALQDSALKTWKGERQNVPAAQSAFQRRARLNGAARTGEYRDSMETERQVA